jgi:hypothetical protein
MHHDILKFAGKISREMDCPMDDILPSAEMQRTLRDEMGANSVCDMSPEDREDFKELLAKEFETMSQMGRELGYLTPELEEEARKLFYDDPDEVINEITDPLNIPEEVAVPDGWEIIPGWMTCTTEMLCRNPYSTFSTSWSSVTGLAGMTTDELGDGWVVIMKTTQV